MSPNKQVEAQERLETEDIDGKKKREKKVRVLTSGLDSRTPKLYPNLVWYLPLSPVLIYVDDAPEIHSHSARSDINILEIFYILWYSVVGAWELLWGHIIVSLPPSWWAGPSWWVGLLPLIRWWWWFGWGREEYLYKLYLPILSRVQCIQIILFLFIFVWKSAIFRILWDYFMS